MRLFFVTAIALTTLGLVGSGRSVFAVEKQAKARRAMVRVRVPVGARLTINGKPAKKATARHFITRPLQQGKIYTYTFKAEFFRGQKSESIAQTVQLRTGQKKVVSFRQPRLSSRYTYGAYRRPASGRRMNYRFSPGSSTTETGRYSTSEFLVWPNGY
jgi:uncharacterized protein (TIGR03000 family)